MAFKCLLHDLALTKNLRSIFCPTYGRNLSGNGNSNEEQAFQVSSSDAEKKQLIEIEMAYEKQSGNFFIPDIVPEKHWSTLLKLKTPNERRHFYRYLKKTELYEKKDEERHINTVLRRKAEVDARNQKNPEHIKYGLWFNSLFIRVSGTSLQKPSYNNLRDAVMFGQKLVIDLGYEEKMNFQELNNCLMQINFAYRANQLHKEPYHVYLCNANMDGQLIQKLKDCRVSLQKPHPLVALTEKSYLELFPKDKLVYLTPHCDEMLMEYNHDDIYIIGGIVDKSRQGDVSSAKAKCEDLRMARLPLEKYMGSNSVEKNLTIDQVIKVLLTMKETMDWEKAFQLLPKRRINHFITMQARNTSFQRTLEKDNEN